MSRKNSSARRKNTRLDRRQKGEIRQPKALEIPRVKAEDIILPDGQCFFQSPGKGKARFSTEARAAKALRQAQVQRRRTGATRVEKRYYACPDGGCGGFHLTSREAFDEDIWRQRRAIHEQKMKGNDQ